MKIGLISDIKHADLREELGLWAIEKVLKERGVLAVVMQEPQTGGVLSEFAVDQFTICAADKEQLKKFGVYQQLKGYVTANPELHAALKEEKEQGGKVLLRLEHPIFLTTQVSFHGISEKPERTKPFLFVDLEKWDEQRGRWLTAFCEKRPELDVLIAGRPGITEKPQGLERAEMIRDITPEKYLGCIWQSAAVVTDTYAGTALSILHEKPFAVLASERQPEGEKEQLLKIMCLSDHLAYDTMLPEGSFEITNTQEFRKALHDYRAEKISELERRLRLEEADMIVKCPVKLPVSLCSACGACEAVCPDNAISMQQDKRGFSYPVVDAAKCSDCDWCINACIKKAKAPFIQYESEALPEIYAASAPDLEGRYTAYSGLFRELVHFVRKEKNGVIFGTTLNEKLEPVISWTEDEEKAAEFAEQRYLIPRTLEAFRKIRELLEEGRFVLFTGIPCQCAGLRGYLHRSYPKLVICELMCHEAVPEKLFQQYIRLLSEKQEGELHSIHFGAYPADSMAEARVITSEYRNDTSVRRKFNASPYYKIVSSGIPVRESCTNCAYVSKKKTGDITLGEFKKVHQAEVPKKWQNESLLLVNTEKGRRILKKLPDTIMLEQIDYETMFKYQNRKTAALSKERTDLFKHLDKGDIKEILKLSRS